MRMQWYECRNTDFYEQPETPTVFYVNHDSYNGQPDHDEVGTKAKVFLYKRERPRNYKLRYTVH